MFDDPIVAGGYPQMANTAKRKRMMADLLLQQSMQPRQQGYQGRISPPASLAPALGQVGEALMARRAGKSATRAENMAESERGLAIANALEGTGMSQYQRALDSGVDPEIVASMIEGSQPQVLSAGARMVSPSGETIADNPAQVSGQNSRFGSPQVTESGRLIVLDRASGRSVYADSGEPWDSESDRISADLQAITLPDGSVQLVNMRPEPGRGGQAGQPSRTEQVVTPEEAVSGAAERSGAERRAADQAAADVDISQTAPAEIQSIEGEIQRNEQMLADLRAGKFQTGFFAGMSPAITTNQQLFDVFSGENVIRAISSATFGQLSEGEREFLTTTVPSRSKSEEANRAIIERRIEILNKAMRLERERLSGAASRTGADVPQAVVPPISLSQAPADNDPLGIR